MVGHFFEAVFFWLCRDEFTALEASVDGFLDQRDDFDIVAIVCVVQGSFAIWGSGGYLCL